MGSVVHGKEKVGAVIVAAGSSKRMEGVDKIFMDIGGKSVLELAVSAFEKSGRVSEIAIVVHGTKVELVREMVEEKKWRKVTAVCPGGERRQDSSFNGAMHLLGCSYIMVHDGARPFVSQRLIRDSVSNAVIYGAAVPVLMINDTVKMLSDSGLIDSTFDRRRLRSAQTPQTFRRDILMGAYKRISADSTDESSMVEAVGCMPKPFDGDPNNIKITTKDDIDRAYFILARRGEPGRRGRAE